MLKPGNAIRLTIIALALAAVVMAGYYAIKQNAQTSGTIGIDDEPTVFHDGSRYRSFQSEELDIAFSYPASWGELNEWVSYPSEDQGGFRAEATISTHDTPFAFLVTHGDSVGRGGWWGDIAVEATSEQVIQSFCDTYQSIEAFYLQPDEACEILINDDGISFARLKGSTQWFGWELEETHIYLAFHPDHPFYGIALSAQSLRRAELDDTLGNTEKAIQEIANSFSFIE